MPVPASAAIMSALRHSGGNGAAIIPARRTPSSVRSSRRCSAIEARPRRRSANQAGASRFGDGRDDAVGFGVGQLTRRAAGNARTIGRIHQRQRIRMAQPRRAGTDRPASVRVSFGVRVRRGSCLSSWRFALPPGFRQIAEQRGLRRMLDLVPARHPLLAANR